jgi:stage V sporulation protein R
MAYHFSLSRGRRRLPPDLEAARERIREMALAEGLTFCDVRFEMCDWAEINMIAAYGGFPIRYPHWRFGMDYLRMDKGYEYGLQKIYEMVINTDPAYAYLLDNNTSVDQKLVMAHVYGHVDFFTNNAWFANTNRRMLDEVANHAARIRRYIDQFGVDEVERVIDACLSIENLIDPMGPQIKRERAEGDEESQTPSVEASLRKLPSKSYMDKFINPPDVLDAQRKRLENEEREKSSRFPEEPARDILLFLMQNAPMAPWQADVLAIIREEAYYFAPQGRTKIMNEGWASYWHTWLMTRRILDDSEIIDYADHHSGTVAMSPGQLNPYKMGLELFRDIEDRWNKGRFGRDWAECDDAAKKRSWDTGAMLGRKKIFEVRRTHNDVTFVDEFFTEDFCREHGFFAYEYDKDSGQFVVDSREFWAVKQKLLFMISNHGSPRIKVTDGNRANRGELELTHEYEGVEIQIDWAQETLGNLALLWTRPVHLLTVLADKPSVLTHDGHTFKLSDAQAPPA